MLAQKVSHLLAGQGTRVPAGSSHCQSAFQVFSLSCNDKPDQSENAECFETPGADNYFSTNIQTLGVYQSARVSPRPRKQNNQDISTTTLDHQTLDTSEVKSKYNHMLKMNRDLRKELTICQNTIGVQGKQLCVFEKREVLLSDIQEKLQITEDILTLEKKQKQNYIKQLKETKAMQKQTLVKLDSMEVAMNELEAMKANYKKLLKGQRATRTSLSRLGSTSTINEESGRSTGHLEKTLSGHSNFSVTRKKEKKEKYINIEGRMNTEYTRNGTDETRMSRLNKLQSLQIEPPSD